MLKVSYCAHPVFVVRRQHLCYSLEATVLLQSSQNFTRIIDEISVKFEYELHRIKN